MRLEFVLYHFFVSRTNSNSTQRNKEKSLFIIRLSDPQALPLEKFVPIEPADGTLWSKPGNESNEDERVPLMPESTLPSDNTMVEIWFKGDSEPRRSRARQPKFEICAGLDPQTTSHISEYVPSTRSMRKKPSSTASTVILGMFCWLLFEETRLVPARKKNGGVMGKWCVQIASKINCCTVAPFRKPKKRYMYTSWCLGLCAIRQNSQPRGTCSSFRIRLSVQNWPTKVIPRGDPFGRRKTPSESIKKLIKSLFYPRYGRWKA